ncbi:MAG: Na+/H+ antiporter NhaC [Gammaproteobacteria bacterium]|nr:Na+/H+ antiporter NhaC [Gammaproteobacteria bacterium]
MSTARQASTTDVILTIGTTVALLGASVFMFGSDSSSGANQIALVIGAAIATIVGVKNGHSWKVIEENIVAGISTALPAIMILFSVGSLIGVWMLSGTVPTMIYYGLLLLDPGVFYAACCLLCAVTALSIGSSWTVAGTLGVGLVGVAAGLGLSVEITAGAIISGAYFGDKMSPLSDTTNLAPAVTGIDIFTHIRHMTWTTMPSFVFALCVFAGIGLFQSADAQGTSLDATLAILDAHFNINVLMLLPVALVVYLAARRTPAVASILSGVLAGILIAVTFQRPVILNLAADPSIDTATAMFKAVWIVLFDGYTASTGDDNLDSLLSRGGMSSMLNTVWLILAAMSFGAAMEKAGVLEHLVRGLVASARSVGSLIATTLVTCFGVNALAADQYMAIVVTGRMFKDEYRKRNLHEKNLARVLEDAGTITSPLVPWNTCGAYMAATLGVPTLAYLPFCFFNLVNPFVSAAYGYTNFTIEPAEPEPDENLAQAS